MTYRVLVTGSSGYIGRHLVKALHAAGHVVEGLDLYPDPDVQPFLRAFHRISLLDPELERVARGFDAVFHLAALVSVEDSVAKPDLYYETNVQGSLQLFRATRGVPEIIVASTAAAECPTSPYALSKLAMEQVLRSIRGQQGSTILRFFNVAGYGEWFARRGRASHLINAVAEAAAGLRELTINGTDYSTPDGTCVREYVHVMDVVETMIGFLGSPSCSPHENVSTGLAHSCLEVVNTMQRILGADIPFTVGPRRPGDPAVIRCPHVSPRMSRSNRTLEDMCRSSLMAARLSKERLRARV